MKKRAVAVALLVLAGVMPAGLMAQAKASPPSTGKMGGEMAEECKAMMAKHLAMKAEMTSLDAKLDSLLGAMNAAQGDKKVDATAAVVNELVAQRKAMRDHMAMGPQMMQHMMQHERTGTKARTTMPISGCPMMQAVTPQGDEPTKHH